MMPANPLFRSILLTATLLAPAAIAQNVGFGMAEADASAAVELTADELSVDQGSGRAEFTGNVLIAQGAMRLAADKVSVTYAKGDQREIESLEATGNVTLVSGTDAAEAAQAVYQVGSGNIVLTGDVVVAQGENVLSGEKVEVNLRSGTATVSGRVRTVLQPGAR